MHTQKEWLKRCEKITAGYIPTGGKEQTYYSGVMVANFLISRGFIFPGSTILDVGSGNGRLAMGLDAVGFPCSYYGMEIILPCVQFCKSAFADLKNYHFNHVDIYSKHYWSKGKLQADKVNYPYLDKTFNSVIAMSLFSHTGTVETARRNLEEMKRVLVPSGRIVCTWYFGEPVIEEDKTVYKQEEIISIFDEISLDYGIVPWDATNQTTIILKGN